MHPKTARAVGTSSFAIVEGEALPCVSKYWRRDAEYNETELSRSPETEQFVEAIRNIRKVVLTADKAMPREGRATRLVRTGYIAVYAVDDIEFDDAGLRFRFTDRVCSLLS